MVFVLLFLVIGDAAESSLIAIDAHERPISAVAFSPDGRTIATCSDDQTVKLWDASSGKLRRRWKTPGAVTSLTIGSDGERVAVGLWNGRLSVWSVAADKELWSIEAHRENITAAAFSPDGETLATASGDDRCRLWDAARGESLRTIESENEYDVTCLAFSPNGERIALGDGENRVRLYDAASGELEREFVGHEETVSTIAFLDQDRLVSGGWDDTLRIWDVGSGRELKLLRGHSDDVTSLAYHRTGLLITGGAEGDLRRWDVAAGKSQVLSRGEAIGAVVISADGKRVAFSRGRRLFVREIR